jgi:DNA-binding IclR family transcriptional regulator
MTSAGAAPAFDPQRVLSSRTALDAFRAMAAAAREAGAAFNDGSHPLGGLARGEPVPRAALDALLAGSRRCL